MNQRLHTGAVDHACHACKQCDTEDAKGARLTSSRISCTHDKAGLELAAVNAASDHYALSVGCVVLRPAGL
jgi:hypothetical protein